MAKRRPALVEITPEDVAGRYHVEVRIEPSLPQDDMVKTQLAQAFRSPGPDGKPLMSAEDVLEQVLKFANPDLIRRRVDDEWIRAADPEVQKLVGAALRRRFRENNEELVRDAERELNPPPDKAFRDLMKGMTPEKLQLLIRAAAQLQNAQAAGRDPNAIMDQAEMAAAETREQQAQIGRLPPTVMPYADAAPGPEIQSPQAAMTGREQPVEADQTMIANQMRRGMMPPR